MAESNIKLESITRLASLPIVNYVWGFTAEQYGRAKENSTLGYVFDRTETIARKAVETAMPVVNKFEKPISAIDQIAVNGLDYLEKTVPGIKKDPFEVSNTINLFYCKTIRSLMSTKAYEKLKESAGKKLRSVLEEISSDSLEVLNQHAQTSLDLADKMMDKVLHPVEKEEELEKGDGTLCSRVVFLFNLAVFRLRSSSNLQATLNKMANYYEKDELPAKFMAVGLWLYLLSKSTLMSLGIRFSEDV